MAAKGTTLNELGEMLALVVERMTTKDDLAAVRTELKTDIAALAEQVAGIERDLKSIRRDLKTSPKWLTTSPATAKRSTMPLIGSRRSKSIWA